MKKNMTVRNLVLCALFIALSLIGAMFKPFGNSIAFDSFPAYLSASLMGPGYGAVVGLLGHMATAMYSGFPMGLGIHIMVAVLMALVMLAYGWLSRKVNMVVAAVVGVVLNGVVVTALFIPIMGTGFFVAMVGPLTLVSAVNIVLALVVQIALQKMGAVKQFGFAENRLWKLK